MGRTDEGMRVLRWWRQTKKTPTVMLPSAQKAESIAATRVASLMSLIVRRPTVALVFAVSGAS